MKRIVIFKGGLGNQMFQYGMYAYQESVRGLSVAYLYREADHNGFELDKYFDVSLTKAPWYYRCLYELAWRLHKYGIYKQLIRFEQPENHPTHELFINGHWAGSNKYIAQQGFNLAFKPLPLSAANKRIAAMMQQPGSVAIHVRRGDYLLPQNRRLFNTLGRDYYMEAIGYVKREIANARFFFFSDDIEWVKTNLRVDNAEYIDWNTGDDSIYDMYLMSQAAANIMANSTFSFWAAFLNKRTPLVIYPRKWYANGKGKENLFPDNWIGM